MAPIQPPKLPVPGTLPGNNTPVFKPPKVIQNGGVKPPLVIPIVGNPIPASTKLPQGFAPVTSPSALKINGLPVSAFDTFEATPKPKITNSTSDAEKFERILDETVDNKAEYREQFEKLSPELQEKYKSIINDIDFENLENDDILKDIFQNLLIKPEILSHNPELIADLIKSRNKFGLILLEKGCSEEEIRNYEEEGIFEPEILEGLHKIDLDDIPFKNIENILFSQNYIKGILTFTNPKNLNNLLKIENGKGIAYIYSNIIIFQKFINGKVYNKQRKNDIPTTKEKICLKLLLNGSTLEPAKIMKEQYPKMIKFLETFYGDILDEILADPNLNIYSLDPIEYGLPEIVGFSNNAVLVKENNPKYNVVSYINAANNKRMYRIVDSKFFVLNNGDRVYKSPNRYVTHTVSHDMEMINLDNTGFANIYMDKQGKIIENSHREVLDDGTEKEIIDMKTNEGGVFSKHTTISPDRNNFSSKMILTDKDSNRLFESNTTVEQRPDGNTVKIAINGKTETFTSKIEDDKVILTHNDKSVKVSLYEFVRRFGVDWFADRNTSVETARTLLECPDGELKDHYNQILNDISFIDTKKLALKTIENYKDFISKVKADDLLLLLKNKQLIDLNQFGYDADGKRIYSKKFVFTPSQCRVTVDPYNPTHTSNPHELGHGIDEILKISDNPGIQKIYNEELANVSPAAQVYLDYFLSASGGTLGGLPELVAESHAIFDSPEMKNMNPDVAIRILMLMKEMPRSVKAVMEEFAKYKAGL